jgi:inorganic phosphate transporter, PiT family
MTTLATVTLVLTIAFAVLFDMTNGWNDAANAVATVISTRVLTPIQAIAFGAVLNFIGALFSSEVAKTVGKEIASPELLQGAGGAVIFLTAVMTAPVWITFCSRRGLPNSCSHALLGALIGAVIASSGGFHGLEAKGIQKIFLGVLICPIAGFLLGHILARVVTWIAYDARPVVASAVFGKMQLVSAGAMAFAHGTGDAQKAMGIITGALLTAGVLHATPGHEFSIPLWVRIMCASAMALGTSLGGWRVMRTLGSKLIHLRTYQGFAAETAAATTILMNTLGGVPISTTHSITGAIMGVGSERGVKAVRWGVGKKIVFAWIVTFPVCILAGALMCLLLKKIGF